MQPCASYLFVGVRGSDEHNQFGNTIGKVRTGIETEMDADGGAATSVRSIYIDYTAAAFTPVTILSMLGHGAVSLPAPYLQSVADGVSKLNSVLNDSWERCRPTHEKWIFAGYSQGAEVVDQVLHSTIHSANVAGVALVGDAGNYPGKPRTLVGRSPDKKGAGIFDVTLTRYETPASLAAVTTSLCSYGDTICDFSNDRYNPFLALGGLIIHTTYKSQRELPSYFNPLADKIAAGIQAVPTPTPTPTPAPTPIGAITDPGLKACVVDELKNDLDITTTDPTSDQVARLTKVACSSQYAVNGFGGMQYASALTSFSSAGAGSDLTPFRKLPALQVLSVSGGVNSIAPLTGNTTIRSLAIGSAPLADASAAATMPALTQLSLAQDEITDLRPLNDLRSRVQLYLRDQMIQLPTTTVGAVVQLPDLYDFNGNRIAADTPLPGETTLAHSTTVDTNGHYDVNWMEGGSGSISWHADDECAQCFEFDFTGHVLQTVTN